MKHLKSLLMMPAVVASLVVAPVTQADSCPAFLDNEMRKLHSSDTVNLCDLAAGKPMLVVNTASRCG